MGTLWLLVAACASQPATVVRGPADEGDELDRPTRPTTVEDPDDTTEDTGTPPSDTGPGTTETGLPEDTGTPADTGESSLQACYPGSALDWTVCMPLVQPALDSDYDYPPMLDGDPQYREPVAWLDLAVEDPGTAIAPNFVLEEIAQEWKGRYAVVLPGAIQRLQDVRDDLGALIINSGYRNPAYNASVGGVEYSRHQYGDAFDIDPVSVGLSTLADSCYDHDAGYVGVYETHIHCDWRNDTVDEAFYGVPPTGMAPGTAGLPVHDAQLVLEGSWWTAPASGWDEGEPLREWVALDEAGGVLAQQTGRRFAAPEHTATVRVTVGRAVVRTAVLP